MSLSVPDFVPVQLQQLELPVNAGMLPQLADYLGRLLDANRRFNLTGIREIDEAWKRHIIDSLTLLPGLEHLAKGGKVIDVGSGGGLPGMPLAIARPDLSMTLLEATGKKANFLEQTAGALGLSNVTVLNDRAERVGRDPGHRQAYDVVVCRAVGPMRELLEYTLPLVRVGGHLLAMKGPTVEGELEQAGNALEVLGAGELRVYDAYPESFGQQTVIVSIEKQRPTPRTYPRHPGLPRQSPL